MSKVLVIVGPTAVGKTSLAVYLACHFGGEIVSADSRQVYKGMDIVTGKDVPSDSELRIRNYELGIKDKKLSVGFRLKDNIPIWLVDIAVPDYQFNLGEYTKIARVVIHDIQKRNKLPIIVGGTGLYIRSLLNPLSYVDIPPDKVLRKRLESLDKNELQREFRRLNPDWWSSMNNSDKNNARRLVRAIEISKYSQIHNVSFVRSNDQQNNMLAVGLTVSKDILFERINKRVDQRIKDGALDEIKELLNKGYSWNLISFSSSGIKQLKDFFENKKSLEEAISKWKLAEIQYAKRQLTWFKKESNIVWFDATQKNFLSRIEEKVQTWYTQS